MNKKLEARGFIRELVSINEDGTETWIEKPFYMYPKEWQELSDDEISELAKKHAVTSHNLGGGGFFAMEIQQKLKEKNT
jgi:hypothetical protein